MATAKPSDTLYIVLDITKVEETRVRYVAAMQEAVLLGKIYMHEHPGRKVTAPILEGRSLSKLSLDQLQYLYWNMSGKKPASDYAKLLAATLETLQAITPEEVDIPSLEGTLESYDRTVARSQRSEGAPATATSKAKAPAIPKPAKATKQPGDAPKKTSICGYIWEICNKHYDSVKGKNKEVTKEMRSAIIAECEKEGINKSTASVQFGKWKATKSS